MSKRHDSEIKKNEWTVSQDFDKQRLDYWLKKKISFISYPSLCRLIRKGVVRVNGKRIKNSSLLNTGDIVRFSRIIANNFSSEQSEKYNKKFSEFILNLVIFKDEEFLVINKPSGLAVQGGTKIKLNIDLMLDSLKFNYNERPRLVHRIDKQTSGLLIIARTLSSSKYFGKLFKEREMVKTYVAIVKQRPKNKNGKIELDIEQDDKKFKSLTYFKVLFSNDKLSILLLRPVTGRKHQLRIHLNYIGTPILGETKFKGLKCNQFQNLHLHAYHLRFNSKEGLTRDFYAPLPDYFESTMNKLKINLNFNDNLEFNNLKKFGLENAN